MWVFCGGKFYIGRCRMDNPSNNNESEYMVNTRIVIMAVTIIAIVVIASIGAAIYYQGANNPSPTPNPTASPQPTQNPTQTAAPATFPVIVTDDTNYATTILSYPQTIVSLAPANTQLLFAVGAGGQVKGVTDYDKYPYNFTAWIEAGNMSSIGNYYQPAVEPIVALNPDLIVASLGSTDAASTLRGLGYKVITINPQSLDGMLNNMLLIGNATGHYEEAQTVVAGLQQRINVVVNGVRNATSRPTVYHEIWSDPYMSVGKGTFVDNAIQMAGGQNIFENATDAYPTVSAESIIEENPQIIVFPTQMGVESFWGNYTMVAARPGWSTISAVVNNKMYTISGDIIDEPGPRQIDCLEMLAKIIHPEIFGNFTDQ
jgi:iron complex transport system substrate-binding protein